MHFATDGPELNTLPPQFCFFKSYKYGISAGTEEGGAFLLPTGEGEATHLLAGATHLLAGTMAIEEIVAMEDQEGMTGAMIEAMEEEVVAMEEEEVAMAAAGSSSTQQHFVQSAKDATCKDLLELIIESLQ